MTSSNTTTPSSDQQATDVVDVDAVRHDDGAEAQPKINKAAAFAEKFLHSSALGGSVLTAVAEARASVRDQFQLRRKEAQERLQVIEKKAQELVDSVQTSVQTTAQGVAQRAREEKQEAVQKVEQVAHGVAGKFEPGLQAIESWLRLPADVREDALTSLGVASSKQIEHLHEELAALAVEMRGHFAAQTELLLQLAPPAPEGEPRKTRAKKTEAAQG